MIEEGFRITKYKGRIIICEVRSRVIDDEAWKEFFSNNKLTLLHQFGNNYFEGWIVEKSTNENELEYKCELLKPCVYKKR